MSAQTRTRRKTVKDVAAHKGADPLVCLTAYDAQRIKSEYVMFAQQGDTEWLGKAAIMGALSLYINFINMFIMLLSLFGSRE